MRFAAFYENILTAVEQSGIPLPELLERLTAEGLGCIYISGDSLSADEEGLLKLFSEKGLPVEGIHQHFDLGHDPGDPSLEATMDLAKRAGAGSFLLVPGMVPKGEEDRAEILIRNMLAGARRAVEYGQRIGVTVCMEDYDHMTSPYNSAKGLARFLEEVPGMKCCFDTGNFVCYGEDPLAAFPRFADDICAVHLKDRVFEEGADTGVPCVCADGSRAYTAPVGSGEMPIRQILGLLRQRGYAGNAVVELYGCGDMLSGLIRSLNWVRQFA